MTKIKKSKMATKMVADSLT